MYDYLLNEGVEKPLETESLEVDVDITDRLILESQINSNRKDTFKLIRSKDALYNQYIVVSKEITRLEANHHNDPDAKTLAAAKANDEEYQDARIKLDAIKFALKSVDDQIAFLKQDSRILTNTMYTK